MMFVKPTESPGGGLIFRTMKTGMINRSGSTFELGDVIMVDLAASVAEVDATDANSWTPGGTSTLAHSVTVWKTARAVSTTVLPDAVNDAGLVGVCLESIVNDAEGSVAFQGNVSQAFIISTSPVAPGFTLVTIDASQDFDGVAAAGERAYAIYCDVNDTDLATHERKRVLLQGVFGIHLT